MYVAVKGGERAIEAAHRLVAEERRGDPAVPALTTAQITEQLTLAVDRVMAEGSLYDRELAALAIKQARGDLIEAIFLIRAVPHDAAALRLLGAARHGSDGGAAAGLGNLQGHSRRPDPRADLRLFAPVDRLLARRRKPAGTGDAGARSRRRCDAPGAGDLWARRV